MQQLFLASKVYCRKQQSAVERHDDFLIGSIFQNIMTTSSTADLAVIGRSTRESNRCLKYRKKVLTTMLSCY